MAKEREDNFVNPKQVLRAITAAVETQEQAQTLVALWAYSDGYIPKETLDAGKIIFGGEVSYSQLDGFYHFKLGTSKKRVERLRDSGLVDWSRTRYGIRFKVQIGIDVPDSDSEVSGYPQPSLNPAALRPSQSGIENSSQVSGYFQSGIEVPPVRYRDTPSVLSGVKESGSTGIQVTEQSLRSDETTSKATPTPVATAPHPVQPSAPQAIDVPPAPRPVPVVDFTNPVHSHDWSQDKNICANCQSERSEVRIRNLTCAQAIAEIEEIAAAYEKRRAVAVPQWED